MKTIKCGRWQVTTRSDKWRVTSDRKDRAARGAQSRHPSPATRHPSAFSLVELLVVITIISVVVAFTVPAYHAVKINQYEHQTEAEMGQLKDAIGSYKDARGFYPPDSPQGPLLNPLYYELEGTTLADPNNTYTTLDSSDTITTSILLSALGVNGIVNCSKGSGEDAVLAKNFVHELRPNQTAVFNGVKLFVGSVGGPDPNYTPLPGFQSNPWRYVAQGTNNPGGYDLWIQLSISGKKYLICNWSTAVQINSPLP